MKEISVLSIIFGDKCESSAKNQSEPINNNNEHTHSERNVVISRFG